MTEDQKATELYRMLAVLMPSIHVCSGAEEDGDYEFATATVCATAIHLGGKLEAWAHLLDVAELYQDDDPGMVHGYLPSMIISTLESLRDSLKGRGGNEVLDQQIEQGLCYMRIKVSEWSKGEPENLDTSVKAKSSHGYIYFNGQTGDVISVHRNDNTDESAFLTQIIRFNVTEWEENYDKVLSLEDEVDILDLGYWYVRQGRMRFEEPDEDARELIAENLKSVNVEDDDD